jgi:hypothetical protein
VTGGAESPLTLDRLFGAREQLWRRRESVCPTLDHPMGQWPSMLDDSAEKAKIMSRMHITVRAHNLRKEFRFTVKRQQKSELREPNKRKITGGCWVEGADPPKNECQLRE